MEIRTAEKDDLRAVTELEAVCFPAAEAPSEARFEQFREGAARGGEACDVLGD